MSRSHSRANAFVLLLPVLLFALFASVQRANGQAVWRGYAGNAQHTALSGIPSQPLTRILWQTPVDLQPQYSGNDLLIHYGSPLVTQANTILVPVKTGANDGFRVEARKGTDGSLLWRFDSDYTLPAHNWTPSYGPTLTPNGRVYMAGAGGTVYYRDTLDSAVDILPTQVAFYGTAEYNAHKTAYNSSIQICTPLTSDSAGNVFFGYRSTGSNPMSISSGIARVAPDGTGRFVTVSDVTGAQSSQVVLNCAPALSNDGSMLYIATNTGGFSGGFLVALNSSTLAMQSLVQLKDPLSGSNATLPDDGTASPMVAPDGKVFFGVLENPFTSARGWLLQFNANLSQIARPGAFGWDDTASVVPANMVASYRGSSAYLLMTKYNNYAGLGGDGVNKLAILDPNDTQTDARTGATVMKEVLTITGPTPDPDFRPGKPNAVREWCINTAVVDPLTDSILVNSEDGKLYRWNLGSNTFTQQIVLTPGIGEAYTPTLIGQDGKVYAINNATLFAVGAIPTASDFNGDAENDLVWQNQQTGDVTAWLMNGVIWNGGYAYLAQNISPQQKLAVVVDLNGDRRADLIWHDQATGEVFCWLMNGTQFLSRVTLGTVRPDPKIWSIGAATDLNGDGKPDLVWQNRNTGDVVVWLLDGASWNGNYAYIAQGISTVWKVVGAGDFNGDGQNDLVWQNQQTGDVTTWLMNGITWNGSYAYLATGLLSGWRVAAVADFNRDGRPDLIWQNDTTGDVAYYLMNGVTWFDANYIARSIPTVWKIVGPH